MNVVLAGGSGFIGSHLAKAFQGEGAKVTVLSRSQGPGKALWDGRRAGDWESALEGADSVVNLCGAGVADWPWTQARRRELVDSRLAPTRALVDAIGRRKSRPKALVNASAVGYYDDGSAAELDERTAPGKGFLAKLCTDWEAEASRAETLGVRTVLLRIGVVLGPDGGALKKMLLPFKLALGGKLGDGSQWTPWIHVDDVVGLVLAALDDERYRGPVNAAAPVSATNAQFTSALGQVLHRPTPFPVPAFALQLVLGEMAGMLLGSQKVVPRAALAAGYDFKYRRVEEALAACVG